MAVPSTAPIKLGILGIRGRLGALCAEEAENNPAFTLVGGTSRRPDPAKNIVSSAQELAERCDVLIDVGHADALDADIASAVAAGTPLVVGVTGYSEAQERLMAEASAKIPLLRAANFSPALAVLTELAQAAGAALAPESFDAIVEETHHRDKRDAPSGTALAIARACRSGGKAGQERKVAFSSTRGGAVVGEHALRFLGGMEEITISHRAYDRRLFADGALMAAGWLYRNNQASKPGMGPWGMNDVVASRGDR